MCCSGANWKREVVPDHKVSACCQDKGCKEEFVLSAGVGAEEGKSRYVARLWELY